MRRLVLTGPGSIDNLQMQEGPSPVPGPGEVLVRVRAVSLNARDLMIVNGPSPYGNRPGLVPGSDCAGEVEQLGAGVVGFAVGDRATVSFRTGWHGGALERSMMATDLGGGCDGVLAEKICVPAAALVPIPDSLSFESACTLPCAGVTAWRALTGGAGLSPAHTVLVTGSGGVAVLALQIAHAMGCRVIATTRSPGKVGLLEGLGASAVILIDGGTDWPAALLRRSDGRGYDRAVNCVGPGQVEQLLACAAPGAELALVGLRDGPDALIAPIALISGMVSLRGISVGSRADLEALVAFCSSRFTPAIDSRYPFNETPAALRRLALGDHVGKIVISVP